MEKKVDADKRPTILLVGNDDALTYLLGRFVEQSQCTLKAVPAIPSTQAIEDVAPKAIIFLSMKHLEAAQPLMTELTGIQAPIIVCAALADESRARELDADHCLFHPITFDHFQSTLVAGSSQKRA
jgi:CheY-like chemotaxis protein